MIYMKLCNKTVADASATERFRVFFFTFFSAVKKVGIFRFDLVGDSCGAAALFAEKPCFSGSLSKEIKAATPLDR
jgi:hypothetical protein